MPPKKPTTAAPKPATTADNPTVLRLTVRTVLLVVGLMAATIAVFAVIGASRRVLGWMLAAAAIAGLLQPIVERLRRRIPRGAAVAVVMIVGLLTVGGVAVATVSSIVHQTNVLKRAAPERARQLEESERFGELATRVKLAERTERLVNDLPQRLRGGEPADAVRSAATRGLAYLATFVLSLFLLLHGPRLAQAAFEQIPDEGKRQRARDVALAAYHRGFGYAGGSLVLAISFGLFTTGLARLAGIPGAVPLGLWAGLWDLLPVAGAVLGALPVIALAAAASPGEAAGLLAIFTLYQVAENLLAQHRLERATVKVGPFITVVTASAGLELYGLGGALLGLLVVAVAAAALDELRPDPAA